MSISPTSLSATTSPKPERATPGIQLGWGRFISLVSSIETIFNSNNRAIVSHNVFWEILEVTSSYETLNLEYNNNFYRLEFAPVDDGGSPNIPIHYILLSWAISLISLTTVILIGIILLINILKIINRAFPFG